MQERIGPVTQLRGAAGALGRRPGVAVAERRDAACWSSAARRALAARAAAHRRWRPASGAATAARPTAPADQRPEDGASLCWDVAAARRAARAARPRGRRARAGRRPARSRSSPRGCATSRPTARSSLIARGVLNLTHREGHDRVVPVVPGERDDRARADAVDGVRGAGRPRAAARGLADLLAVDLAVARAGDADRRRARGSSCRCAARRRSTRRCARSAPPESARGAREGVLRARARSGRVVHHDLATGAVDVEFPWIDHRHVLTESGTLLGERNVVHYRSTEGDPLSADGARARSTSSWSAATGARASAVRSEMTCDRDALPRHHRARRLRGRGAPVRARAGRTRSRGTADEDDPLVLVRGPRDRAARARPDLPAQRGSTRGGARS